MASYSESNERKGGWVLGQEQNTSTWVKMVEIDMYSLVLSSTLAQYTK